MQHSYEEVRTVEDLQKAIGQAQQAGDLEALEELQRYFVEAEGPGPAPFVPAIALNEAEFEAVPSAGEVAFGTGPTAGLSNLAIELANSLDRAKRQAKYQLKIAAGYDGPIIVSEGDSWFQYPLFLEDIIDNVMDEYAVFSLGGGGHLLSDMVAADEYTPAIDQQNADFFLLSGGGNDMVGGGRLVEFVRPYQDGMSPRDVINEPAFAGFRQTLSSMYSRVVTGLTQRFLNLTILFHGYDYALPRRDGQWLGVPLASRGVPKDLWAPVIAILIDEFNQELQSLEGRFPGRVFHIDCRTQVGGHLNSWADELHPKNAGFRRVSVRFLERI
jgi:N-acetylmuramoyl-L-alanine amidase